MAGRADSMGGSQPKRGGCSKAVSLTVVALVLGLSIVGAVRAYLAQPKAGAGPVGAAGTGVHHASASTAIGHVAWDIADCATSKTIGRGSKTVKLSDVTIEGRGGGLFGGVMYDKRIPLEQGFYLEMAESPEKSENAVTGFGVVGGRTGEDTFCWEWFNVDRPHHATKLQDTGELDFDTAPVGSEWQVSRTKFLVDVSIRIDPGVVSGTPAHTAKWRVKIHQGSEIRWPALVGGAVMLVGSP